MAKLKLIAEPTFKAMVGVPIPGGDDVPVEMTFKHRTRSDLIEWSKSINDRPLAEAFMEMVTGWELTDAFTKENVGTFLENYGGAFQATVRCYSHELLRARMGN